MAALYGYGQDGDGWFVAMYAGGVPVGEKQRVPTYEAALNECNRLNAEREEIA